MSKPLAKTNDESLKNNALLLYYITHYYIILPITCKISYETLAELLLSSDKEITETYLWHCQTSMIELFVKIVDSF